ncbi:MAG: hypothetical protein RIN56_17880 [Sporomusaceae bacterium]|nr:hypothetical protein [Sporomusaceae bacterium]
MATLTPTQARISTYNMATEQLGERACMLPGMVGVRIHDLFPDADKPMESATSEETRLRIREITLKTLEKVDLSKIQPGDSVNILTSHHGFSIYGGEAYAEMVRAIRDEVEKRCHTSNIFLRAGVGLRFRETEEYIKKFDLDKYFDGKASGIAPVDKGVPIETELGTLYGIAQAYSAKWIIHAHNNDVRELHYHRQLGRLFKPFAMSYATIETRSSFHQSMGPRAANLIARTIYESPFVQEKFVCAVMLQVGPAGIMGVDADNNLVEQDKRFSRLNLNWYGKVVTLLSRIEDASLIIDYPGPIPYTTAGGILFGNFLNANVDEFNLDLAFTPFTRYTDMLYPGTKHLGPDILPAPNPAIKALIINYSSKGYPGTFFAQQLPTLVVGPQADVFRGCEQNTLFMDYAVEVENLRKAVEFARKFTKTDKVLVFDGAVGGFNVSEALAEYMHKLAPQVAEEVDKELMPMWLRQRGIEAR